MASGRKGPSGTGFKNVTALQKVRTEGTSPCQDPEEHQRQLKKKQKNRTSAQRSRQKHTDKADALHQVGDASLRDPACTHLAQWPLFHLPRNGSPYTAVCSLVTEFGRKEGLCH